MTTIRHALTINANATAVHAALTTPEGIHGWWATDADIGSGVGANHELRFKKGDRSVVMKFVVKADSADEVAWTCTENGNPVWKDTTLTWQLESQGEQTKVVFEHAGFAESESPPYKMTVEGWGPFIESLRRYAETGSGSPA